MADFPLPRLIGRGHIYIYIHIHICYLDFQSWLYWSKTWQVVLFTRRPAKVSVLHSLSIRKPWHVVQAPLALLVKHGFRTHNSITLGIIFEIISFFCWTRSSWMVGILPSFRPSPPLRSIQAAGTSALEWDHHGGPKGTGGICKMARSKTCLEA